MTLKTKITTVLGAVVAAGGLLAATSASATIVCNRYDECWHVRDRLTYPDNVGITFYDDDWTFPNAHYHWMKDRDDRGYWMHGRWYPF